MFVINADVTGASSGIGAATAVLFSKLGATLALTGRKVENLHQVGSQCEKTGGKKVGDVIMKA